MPLWEWHGTGPREHVAVSRALRSWRSKECFNIRYGVAELLIFTAGLWSCFGPVFHPYAHFPMF